MNFTQNNRLIKNVLSISLLCLSILIFSPYTSAGSSEAPGPDVSEPSGIRDAIEKVVPKEPIDQTFKKLSTSLVSDYQNREKDYVLGQEDGLKITVWDHDDLTREVSVSREGWFTYPFIGSVQADGLTVLQLENKLKSALSGKYVINPQVTVTVREYKSKIVYVFGEVGGSGTTGLTVTAQSRGPGVYPLTGRTRLLEILAAAGGPTKDAGTDILIVRPKQKKGAPVSPEEAKKDEIITANLKKLLEGDMSHNIYLEQNDTIFVPKMEFYFVHGEVKKPGKYGLEKGTTFLKAIATAGGITTRGGMNRTTVVREEAGKRIEKRVELTDPVLPEDIIKVPMSYF